MLQKVEFRLHVKGDEYIGPESSQDFVLPVGQAVLGRDPSCELVLAFPLVSRRHAQFNCTEMDCEITDLGSANGTSLNGVKLTPQAPVSLSGGSIITIGPFEIHVEAVPVELPEAEKPEEEAAPMSTSEVLEQPKAPPKPVKKAAAVGTTAMSTSDEPAAEKGQPAAGQEGAPPPPLPPQAAAEMILPDGPPTHGLPFPPGLTLHSLRLLNYLPGIYHTDFMSRFLALFESILIPIEWNVDHFNMYLDPGEAPLGFLPWLANWYTIIFDSTWSEPQRRTLLKEAHQIYARRGTRWALSRVLEIYLGQKPEIIEFTNEKEPFTFTVKLPMNKGDRLLANQELIEAIIDSSKPAHTTYRLEFK